MKKTKMKGREERRVKRGDIALFVDGVGEDVFGVEGSSERRFVSV